MLSIHRACKYAGVLAILFSSWAMAAPPVKAAGKDAAPADGSIKIKLQAVSLSAPGWVMTPADGARPNLNKGLVVPQRIVSLTPDKTAEVTIAGVQATFAFNGRECGVKTEFGVAGLVPARTLDAYMPVAIKIAKDKTYALAFPAATIMMPRGTSFGVRPGFAMRGQANGVTVLLYDDNMDGKFTLGQDAVRIGDAAAVGMFAPATKYVATATALYEIKELAEDGTSITLAKADATTAKVQINYPNDSVEVHAAFASNDTSFVAVANPRVSPTFTVTPGKYEFRYGVAYSPALGKLVASVKPGRLENFEVTSEKLAKAPMGGPFKFDFRATVANGKININPGTIRLLGKNNEVYEDFKYQSAPEVGMMAGGKSVMLGRMSFS